MFHILQDSRERFTSRPVDSEREESSVQIDVAAKVTNYIPGFLSRRVSHGEFRVREVELLEKTATRADLADVTPVPPRMWVSGTASRLPRISDARPATQRALSQRWNARASAVRK